MLDGERERGRGIRKVSGGTLSDPPPQGASCLHAMHAAEREKRSWSRLRLFATSRNCRELEGGNGTYSDFSPHTRPPRVGAGGGG